MSNEPGGCDSAPRGAKRRRECKPLSTAMIAAPPGFVMQRSAAKIRGGAARKIQEVSLLRAAAPAVEAVDPI